MILTNWTGKQFMHTFITLFINNFIDIVHINITTAAKRLCQPHQIEKFTQDSYHMFDTFNGSQMLDQLFDQFQAALDLRLLLSIEGQRGSMTIRCC